MAEKPTPNIMRLANDFYQKALAALERNNLDYAIEMFIQCLNVEPNFTQARQYLRATQMKKTESAGGLKRMFTAAKLTPLLTKAKVSVQKNPTEAMTLAEQALTEDPKNGQALLLLAEAAEIAKHFETVVQIHLMGTVYCTRAAWPALRAGNYGRVVLTSSTSGTFGNFGQANYGAAKAAVCGLANALRFEGAKYNILTNVISPAALTRMTEGLMNPAVAPYMKPELVSPAVAWLCSEECNVSGQIILAQAGGAEPGGDSASPLGEEESAEQRQQAPGVACVQRRGELNDPQNDLGRQGPFDHTSAPLLRRRVVQSHRGGGATFRLQDSPVCRVTIRFSRESAGGHDSDIRLSCPRCGSAAARAGTPSGS